MWRWLLLFPTTVLSLVIDASSSLESLPVDVIDIILEKSGLTSCGLLETSQRWAAQHAEYQRACAAYSNANNQASNALFKAVHDTRFTFEAELDLQALLRYGLPDFDENALQQAFYTACVFGILRSAAHLLPYANINGTPAYRPLVIAAASNAFGTVDWLLGHGADINIEETPEGLNGFRETALMAAIESQFEEMALYLLDHGADPRRGQDLALVRATHHSLLEIVIRLLKAGADPNALYGAPMQAAASLGDLELIRALVDAGANLNLGRPRPLSIATTFEPEILDELEAHGANVTALDGEALCFAARSGTLTSIIWLLERGLSPRQRGCSALKSSAAIGDINAISVYRLFDPHIAQCGDSIALDEAIRHRRPQTLHILLEFGADVNAGGGRPLMLAIETCSVLIIHTLLNHHVNVHVEEELPLRMAIRNHCPVQLIKELVDAGADFRHPLVLKELQPRPFYQKFFRRNYPSNFVNSVQQFYQTLPHNS